MVDYDAIPSSVVTPKVSRTVESIPEAGPHPVIDPVTLYECMFFSFFIHLYLILKYF